MRADIRKKFEAVRGRGEFLVGAAVGTGLFAQAAERGGADFVLALTAGRLRVMGTASLACMLPVCDSNAVVRSFGTKEFLGRLTIPVFYGASAMDPDRSAVEIAECIAADGFAGVMNFPTTAHFPPATLSALEWAGLGFAKEIELLRAAQKLNLWTVCHALTRDQARMAAAAGVEEAKKRLAALPPEPAKHAEP